MANTDNNDNTIQKYEFHFCGTQTKVTTLFYWLLPNNSNNHYDQRQWQQQLWWWQQNAYAIAATNRNGKAETSQRCNAQNIHSDLNLYLLFLPFSLSVSLCLHLHVQLFSLMYLKLLLLLLLVLFFILINELYEIMSLQIIRYNIQWIWLIIIKETAISFSLSNWTRQSVKVHHLIEENLVHFLFLPRDFMPFQNHTMYVLSI